MANERQRSSFESAGLRLAAAVRVGAVALLELGEMRRRQRAVLLGDAGDVGAGVVNPDRLRRRRPW